MKSGFERIDSAQRRWPSLVRKPNSHKGCFGTVGVVGGAPGMLGAALLAGRMALHAGAGKVRLFLLDPAVTVDVQQPELMCSFVGDWADSPDVTVYLIGPGLGKSPFAQEGLARLLPSPKPMVLDADALNLIAENTALANLVRQRTAPTLLTPHPAEAARLLVCSTDAIQTDRLEAAQRLVARYHCTVLLKGSGSVCCEHDRLSINGSGNAALAAAGHGDVLGGLIAALLAQRLPAFEAAELGAWVHGAAADRWYSENPLGLGLTASEQILGIRSVLNFMQA